MYIPNLETLKRVIENISRRPDVPDVHPNLPEVEVIKSRQPKFPKDIKVFY